MTGNLKEKRIRLDEILEQMGFAAVAFSGGVDSTFLLAEAARVLGDRVLAVSVRTSLFPESDQSFTESFCFVQGIAFVPVDVSLSELPGVTDNPPDRCYNCKKAMFTRLLAAVRDCGRQWKLAEGSNMDDKGDYRPGRRALCELGIRSPLQEAGLYKEEIRELSRELELPTWDRPSFACLASRFVYGEPFTKEKLKAVELAENYLKDMGFRQYRVRVHGDLARIEVLPDQMPLLAAHRTETDSFLKKLGFLYVTMDLYGFASGSMNRLLGETADISKDPRI